MSSSAAPVFTEATSCQDCARCVRECPVKAIRVRDGVAAVMPEECLACGHCVSVCPAGAKRIRDDLGQVQAMLEAGQRVVISLAPSWLAEFPGLAPARMVVALRRLGATAVSETARGAQQVSAAIARDLATGVGGVRLSSACPVAVDYLKRHRPGLGALVTDLCSPMLVHARMLRQHFGDDIRVVFVGPCIAKKREADLHPELVAAALTFADLHRWFAQQAIDPARIEVGITVGIGAGIADQFQPYAAHEGSLYPVEGGMLAGIRADCPAADPALTSASGLADFDSALAGVADLPGPAFIELLACRGGCINGPGMASRDGTLAKRLRVIAATQALGREVDPGQPADVAGTWPALPVLTPVIDPGRLALQLARIGKTTPADELNCCGCGYETCRHFAAALAQERAEPSRCVSYTRHLAQSKAAALMQRMPAAAVLVDGNLAIVEANARFAAMFAENQPLSGLVGRPLDGLVPFAARFRHCLAHCLVSGGELPTVELRCGRRVLSVSVFTLDPARLVGGIIQDISAPAAEREAIIARARAVIDRNLQTVSRIAGLLGENAAETEDILGRIIEAVEPGAGTGSETGSAAGAGADVGAQHA